MSDSKGDASINFKDSTYPFPSITFSLTNLVGFLTLLSPFLLTFFIIMLSIVNNNIIKGLLFLMGLVIICYIVSLLKNILKERQSPLASPLCNILPYPFTVKGRVNEQSGIFTSPLTSSTLLGFITSYILFPMYINNNVNHALLVFLVAIFGLNSVVELSNRCGSFGSVVMGGILGILFGIIYYSLIVSSGNKDLAYFSEIKSSAEGCKKPSNQKFKCITYKRGQAVDWV